MQKVINKAYYARGGDEENSLLGAVAVREYALGALINFVIILCYVLLGALVGHVWHFKWLSFLGDGRFFVLISLLAPVFFSVKRKWRIVAGSFFGIVAYFLSVFLVVFTTGVV